MLLSRAVISSGPQTLGLIFCSFRSAENFSVLVIDLHIKRKIANKLASVFTPSLMIVLITFTTFWLGPSSIADRITIGITAFLAIVTQFSQSRAELPPISYISVSLLIAPDPELTHRQAIDVWNLVCIAFVSFQILQATMVQFLQQEEEGGGGVEESGTESRRWTGGQAGEELV